MEKEIKLSSGLRVYSVLTEAGLKKALDIKDEPAEISCPDCDGEGWVEVVDEMKVHSATIDVPYKKIKCEKCDGNGVIENEIES